MRVSIDASQLRGVSQDLRRLAKDAQFAQVLALTRTAQAIKAAEVDEMRRVFDRPTPYTLNSMYLKWATKADPEARVGLKDDLQSNVPASYFLGPNIQGGGRVTTRFERRLQADGAMPKGWFAVPGRFAKLDAYGNLSRGQITQILSQLTKTRVSGYTADISARSRKGAIRRAGQFIALPSGHGKLLPGIYSVSTPGLGRAARGVGPIGRTAPRPVVIFVRAVSYKARFDFDGIGQAVAEKQYGLQLDRALSETATFK
ncbi:MAG: hypothetical protein ABI460_16560 [Caldimonas sp.]